MKVIEKRGWLFLLAVLIVLAWQPLLAAELPDGWRVAGTRPKSYEVGVDTRVSATTESSLTIKSVKNRTGGFGNLMTEVPADAYRGKRIQLSAFLRCEDVDEWAGLWMRVNGGKRDKILAFDNMARRPVRGTRDEWTRYRVVLDVAANANQVSYGFLLNGTGQVWADGVELKVVGDDVPVTDSMPK